VEFSNYRGWIGNTLVYTKTNYNQNGYCNDIKTYDASNGKSVTFFEGHMGSTGCATINLVMKNAFIYSVRNSTDEARNGMYTATLDKSSSKRIAANSSDNTVRRAKQTLLSVYYKYNYSTNMNVTEWDSIDLGDFTVTRLTDGPSNQASRYYNDSPDGTASAFIEERDGKSELYLTDISGKNEKKLTNVGSVNQFVQWYSDDYIVYSSTKTDENALYVIATKGGNPVKISDFYRGNQQTYGGAGNPYN
jgi:hypothetical protein